MSLSLLPEQGVSFPLSPLTVPDGTPNYFEDYPSIYNSYPVNLFNNFSSDAPLLKSSGNSLLECDSDLPLSEYSQDFFTGHNWLSQSTLLPITPEEQPEDTMMVFPVPTHGDTPTYIQPYSDLTPDPSLPPSPDSILSASSTYYSEEEFKDVLSILDDSYGSDDIHQIAPNQPLPLVSVTTAMPTVDVHCRYDESQSPSHTDDKTIRDLLVNSKISDRITNIPKSSERTKGGKSCKVKVGRPAGKRCLSQSVKKERKREQNKTAALRYRQRKKGEKTEVEVNQLELEGKNKILKSKVNLLTAKIDYLKGLWKEVCEAKGNH